MRKEYPTFTPVPRPRNTMVKVQVERSDETIDTITNRIFKSSWSKPLINEGGIGRFTCKVINTGGQYTGIWNAGDEIYFSFDNSGATTLQFYGRIDAPKKELTERGQFLVLEGRHISWVLKETEVCHVATDTDPAQVLMDVMDEYAKGFTYNNVAMTGLSKNFTFDHTPFFEVVKEICQKSGFDCYIGEDKDVHFFEENSILNETDSISEVDNKPKLKNWAEDDALERTHVKVQGKDDKGVPIIYTAVKDGWTSDDDKREKFFSMPSLDTEEKVKDYADAMLAEFTDRPPMGEITSFGLETVKPGDNIWIAMPREELYGVYKVHNHTFTFGREGLRSKCAFEKRRVDMSKVISNRIEKEEQRKQPDNVNKLKFSFNITYDDDSKTETSTYCTESNGSLVSNDDANDGTWISTTKDADDKITKVELRVIGKDLQYSNFYFSVNDGLIWEDIDERTLTTPVAVGKKLKAKVELNRSGFSGLNPAIDSLGLLYT